MIQPDQPISAALHAGPPAANPPLLLAALIICVSIAAPVLFSAAGAPNLLFAIAVLALASAGILTAIGAVNGQRRRRADLAVRLRASIETTGIAFYRQPHPAAPEFFPREIIKRAWLMNSALILDTTPDHPRPGRHRLGFGKLQSSREDLLAALTIINDPPSETAP